MTSIEFELAKCIETMDIPDNRKDTTMFGNITWLSRNIQFKNSNHSEFNKAKDLIKYILKNYYSDDNI